MKEVFNMMLNCRNMYIHTLFIDTYPGDTIEDYCEALYNTCKQYDYYIVIGQFNDTCIFCEPGDSKDDLIRQYYKKHKLKTSVRSFKVSLRDNSHDWTECEIGENKFDVLSKIQKEYPDKNVHVVSVQEIY